MSDCIDRESAIKAIMEDIPGCVYYSKEDAIQCLRAEDAVEPVKHGRWLDYGARLLSRDKQCNQCWRVVRTHGRRFVYCPFCGSRNNEEDT